MLEQPAFLFAPHLTDLHFFVPASFSGDHHIGLSPSTSAIRRAVGASSTSPIRSVAAPRLDTSQIVVVVEHHDLTVVGSENRRHRRRRRANQIKNWYLTIPRSRMTSCATPRHI